ncbi:calponin homology domain-containing protein [Entophlyctis helioformis]|nr:calponin homology domain-containing protein [Entophlyctis helioformis]
MADVVQSLDKDLAAKAAAKYDPAREAEAQAYIESVSGLQFDASLSFAENLKSGVILCKAMNAICPEKPIKIAESKLPFKQMENIHKFLERMTELGVPSFESFQTVDLFEAKNINQVVGAIYSLARHAEKRGFQGARLGPKLAQKTERSFTAEQLLQSKAAVPLLQGFASSVSQAGMGAMGGRREVYNPSIPTGDTTVSSKLLSLNEQSRGALGVSMGSRREIGGKYLETADSQQQEQTGEPSDADRVSSAIDDLLDDLLIADKHEQEDADEVVVVEEEDDETDGAGANLRKTGADAREE